jgi:hypothetical protein
LIEIVRAHAAPLRPGARARFLEEVDRRLAGADMLGPGSLARICREVQRAFVYGEAPRPAGVRRR